MPFKAAASLSFSFPERSARCVGKIVRGRIGGKESQEGSRRKGAV